MQTEDVDYEVSDFAIAEDDKKTTDPDRNNKSVLLDIQEYLAEAINEHNGLDLIDLTEQARMTPTQQIAVHKLVINHLRNIKTTVDNKVKEL